VVPLLHVAVKNTLSVCQCLMLVVQLKKEKERLQAMTEHLTTKQRQMVCMIIIVIIIIRRYR